MGYGDYYGVQTSGQFAAQVNRAVNDPFGGAGQWMYLQDRSYARQVIGANVGQWNQWNQPVYTFPNYIDGGRALYERACFGYNMPNDYSLYAPYRHGGRGQAVAGAIMLGVGLAMFGSMAHRGY